MNILSLRDMIGRAPRQSLNASGGCSLHKLAERSHLSNKQADRGPPEPPEPRSACHGSAKDDFSRAESVQMYFDNLADIARVAPRQNPRNWKIVLLCERKDPLIALE